MVPTEATKTPHRSQETVTQLLSALERATDAAESSSLPQILASLERLKAIAWGRLFSVTAAVQREPLDPLDDLRHLTPSQVAELLSLKEAYVHELCRSRKIPASKQGKYWMIPAGELREWLARSRKGIDPHRLDSVRLPDRSDIAASGTTPSQLRAQTQDGAAGRRHGPVARRLPTPSPQRSSDQG